MIPRQTLLPISIMNNRHVRKISLDEVEFKVTEFADKFLISGQFKPLDIRVQVNIIKQEPKLVSITQLKASQTYEEVLEQLLEKVNSKLMSIKKTLDERTQ